MHAQKRILSISAERVGFFGIGASNLSLLSMLPRDTSVTLRADGKIDRAKIPKGVRIERILEGDSALSELTEEILFLSPSVRRDRPELIRARERGIILSSDAELFFKSVNRPVIAVSGSSGKSTTAYLTAALINGTTSLVAEKASPYQQSDQAFTKAERTTPYQESDKASISAARTTPYRESDQAFTEAERTTPYQEASGSLICAKSGYTHPNLVHGHRAVLCGNIGKPMVESIRDDATVYVTELSSFMLMSHTAQIKRSAITNIKENHLDFHKSMKEYSEAKLSLLRLSEEIIINADDRRLSKYAGRSRRVFGVFSTELSPPELLKCHKAQIYMTLEDGFICRNGERIIDTARLARRERHNVANMMCAILLSDGYGSASCREAVLSSFGGLPHRCETVGQGGGVTYINSSIDTTPDRTAATLSGLSGNVILLLGGRGKGLSLCGLDSALRGKVKSVITFGEDGERIASELQQKVRVRYLGSFENATVAACRESSFGDTVLLSPASTSYDEFSSFEQRGNKFKEIVGRFLRGEIS